MQAEQWSAFTDQFQRFGVKLMILYLGLLLIPVSGIGLFGNFYIQRSIEQYNHQSYLDNIMLHADALNRTTEHIRDDIGYLEAQITTIGNVDFTSFAEAHAIYHHIALLDHNQQVILGNAAAPLQQWAASEADGLLRSSADDVHFHAVNDMNGSAALIAIARIDAGMLILTLNTHELIGSVSATQPDESWVLLMPSGSSLVAGSLPSKVPDLSGHSGFRATADDVFFYYRTGPNDAWMLLRRAPASAMRANLSDYYTTFLILLVGGMVSVVGFALFAIARIIEPIYQLKAMFDQLREGMLPKLPVPLPKDEFGSLMGAFARLATELDQKRRIERDLVERLITAQEEERKLIAYDLHDGLIQHLVGARFYLRKCQTCSVPTESGSGEVRRGYDVLTQAITEGRRIIQGLHPTELDDLGLEAALTDLLEMTAATANWDTTLHLDPLPDDLHRVTSVTLYRITQEALNNAFKHACATHIELSLRCTHNELVLTVTDNGSGFTPEGITPGREGGWGIRTMQERAVMLHGTCAITSQPLKGTIVRVQVPCREKSYERDPVTHPQPDMVTC